MNKTKKLLIVLITVSVLISSVQVYAATVLDSDIISLIKEGIEEIKNSYVSQSEDEIDTLKSQYEEDIYKFIGERTDEFLNNLKKHKDAELNRANQELTNFFEQTKTAISNEIDSALDHAKADITNKIDEEIEETKKAINETLKSTIKDKLKQKN